MINFINQQHSSAGPWAPALSVAGLPARCGGGWRQEEDAGAAGSASDSPSLRCTARAADPLGFTLLEGRRLSSESPRQIGLAAPACVIVIRGPSRPVPARAGQQPQTPMHHYTARNVQRYAQTWHTHHTACTDPHGHNMHALIHTDTTCMH